jgi:hypothetical protein
LKKKIHIKFSSLKQKLIGFALLFRIDETLNGRLGSYHDCHCPSQAVFPPYMIRTSFLNATVRDLFVKKNFF